MKSKATESKYAFGNLPGQIRLKRAGGGGRHLVLDGDVETGRVTILSGQGAVEMVGNLGTQGQHAGAFQGDSRAAPEIHQA